MDGKLGKNKQTRFFSKIFSFFLPLHKTINRFLTKHFRSRTGLCRIASCLAFGTDHTVYHFGGYFYLDVSNNIQDFFLLWAVMSKCHNIFLTKTGYLSFCKQILLSILYINFIKSGFTLSLYFEWKKTN